jgi:hypothetical protein
MQEMQDQMGRTLKAAVADAIAEKEATFERLGAAREHSAELQDALRTANAQIRMLHAEVSALHGQIDVALSSDDGAVLAEPPAAAEGADAAPNGADAAAEGAEAAAASDGTGAATPGSAGKEVAELHGLLQSTRFEVETVKAVLVRCSRADACLPCVQVPRRARARALHALQQRCWAGALRRCCALVMTCHSVCALRHLHASAQRAPRRNGGPHAPCAQHACERALLRCRRPACRRAQTRRGCRAATPPQPLKPPEPPRRAPRVHALAARTRAAAMRTVRCTSATRTARHA